VTKSHVRPKGGFIEFEGVGAKVENREGRKRIATIRLEPLRWREARFRQDSPPHPRPLSVIQYAGQSGQPVGFNDDVIIHEG
jgi:hypothetical protein